MSELQGWPQLLCAIGVIQHSLAVVALSARDGMERAGCKNYFEWQVQDDIGAATITVQPQFGKSPAELRERALMRIGRALDVADQDYDQPHKQVEDMVRALRGVTHE